MSMPNEGERRFSYDTSHIGSCQFHIECENPTSVIAIYRGARKTFKYSTLASCAFHPTWLKSHPIEDETLNLRLSSDPQFRLSKRMESRD
jgi:hypothetical protein